MASCYLDANFLVYLKNETSFFHQYSKSLLEKLIEEKFQLIISPLIIDEFLHSLILIFRRVRVKNLESKLRKNLKEILNLPNLKIVNSPIEPEKQLKIIRFIIKYNLRPRDAYHLLTMQEHKISHFVTFDNDFEKVFGKKLIKPVTI